MNKILQLYDKLSLLRVKLPRILDARKELKMKYIYKNYTLNNNDLRLIRNLWKSTKTNNKYFRLYNSNSEKFDPRYIPDDLYYGTIDPYFNRALDCAAIDDKNLYDLLFPDITQPKTIIRKIKGTFQDKFYQLISEETALQLCVNCGAIVLKKSVNSDGGHGICFWDTNKGIEKLKKMLYEMGPDIVVQEIIKQHENINAIHPNSVNSIRILTLNWKNEIIVLSSILRMGVDGNNVDNGHSGGIFTGIDDNGRLKDVAYTYMSGKKFENIHPTTKRIFNDCIIPNYEQCKELVKQIAPRISRFSKLTSWDLSVNEAGEPLLIEVNMCYGGLFFHQITNGPVFGEMTEEIINEVFKHK